MKKLVFLILFMFAGIFYSSGIIGQPGKGRLVSPEVHPDCTVTFRFRAPAAGLVELSGEFLRERVPLEKDTSGIWSVTVGPVGPDLYPYSFVVDGTGVADPNNPHLFPNEGFQRSLVDIPGDPPLIHAMKDVLHGTVSYRYYRSGSLDLIRPLVIYTPPGYRDDGSTEYPVLYLVHGMTDTEETWFKVGRVNRILDNLIAEGKAEPMIIVMPYANPFPALLKKNRDTDVNLLRTDHFTSEMLREIIPFMEANYRVLGDPGHRAIAGFSLGGRQCLAAGLGHPEVFGWVFAFAPAIFDREMEGNFKNLYAVPEVLNANLKILSVSCGKDDGLIRSARALMNEFEERGIQYDSFITEGGHTWMNCRLFISEAAQKLFK
ncbi:MAG: esterase [Bacteroidales bacterium]|nr:esterase [Bacteroidales bacterium]